MHYLEVWPGGRRVLAERENLTPAKKERAEKLFRETDPKVHNVYKVLADNYESEIKCGRQG